MIVKNDELHHIATDINIEGPTYGAIVTIIGEDGVEHELRWATGTKPLE